MLAKWRVEIQIETFLSREAKDEVTLRTLYNSAFMCQVRNWQILIVLVETPEASSEIWQASWIRTDNKNRQLLEDVRSGVVASGACRVSVYLWSVIRTFLCFSSQLKEHSQAFCHVKAPVRCFFFFFLQSQWGPLNGGGARGKTCHSDRWQPHLHLTLGPLLLRQINDQCNTSPAFCYICRAWCCLLSNQFKATSLPWLREFAQDAAKRTEINGKMDICPPQKLHLEFE